MTLEPHEERKVQLVSNSGYHDIIAINMLERLVNNATRSREAFFKQFDPRRDYDKECGYIATSELDRDAYRDMYDRESIATRVVQVLPMETWKSQPTVFEDEDNETVTPFEQAWDQLGDSLRGQSFYKDERHNPVWEYLQRADMLSGIGHFGVILLGFDDGKALSEPVEMSDPSKDVQGPIGGSASTDPQYYGNWVNVVDPHPDGQKQKSQKLVQNLIADFKKKKEEDKADPNKPEPPKAEADPTGEPASGGKQPPSQPNGTGSGTEFDAKPGAEEPQQMGEGELLKEVQTKRKLLYMRVFDESLVQISAYETDPNSPRFAQPTKYLITLSDPREHHSGAGLPLATVQVHWSRVLHVADNLGSSEIFGVPRQRPVWNKLINLVKLYGGSAEMYWRGAFPGLSFETHPQLGGDVEIDREGMREAAQNYFDTLQRYIATEGMSVKTLSPQVVDPSVQIDTQITGICILLGCPKRVFMGSERGELASGQDDDTWKDRLQARRTTYVIPRIIIPFVDRLIAVGVLPEPMEYHVDWDEHLELNPQEQADVAQKRLAALAAYLSGGVDALIAPRDILIYEFGYDEETADELLKSVEEHLALANPDADPNQPLVPGHQPPPAPPQIGPDGKPLPPDEQQPPGKGQPPGKKPPFGKGKPGDKADEEKPAGKKEAGKAKPPFDKKAVENYDPNQPRAPKGDKDGGKWTAQLAPHELDEYWSAGPMSSFLDASRGELTVGTVDSQGSTVSQSDYDRIHSIVGRMQGMASSQAVPAKALYRGEVWPSKAEALANFKVGQEYVTESLKSFAGDRSLAEVYIDPQNIGVLDGDEYHQVIIKINNPNLSVRGFHAQTNDMNEYIIPKGEGFRVSKVQRLLRPGKQGKVSLVTLESLNRVENKYDPSQPRAPKGDAHGGEWTSDTTQAGGAIATDDDILGQFDSGPEGSEEYYDAIEEQLGIELKKPYKWYEVYDQTEWSPARLAKCAGAFPGSTVFCEPTRNKKSNVVMVDVRTDDFHGQSYLDMDNMTIWVASVMTQPKAQGKGIATKYLATLVENARNHGFKNVGLLAGGAGGKSEMGDNGMNGYYTWPRLGFDAELYNVPELAKARKKWGTRVSDAMKSKEGRDWWRANGTEMEMRFNLDKDSLSSRVLDEYVRGKGIVVNSAVEGFELDDALLDAIWDRIGKEERDGTS